MLMTRLPLCPCAAIAARVCLAPCPSKIPVVYSITLPAIITGKINTGKVDDKTIVMVVDPGEDNNRAGGGKLESNIPPSSVTPFFPFFFPVFFVFSICLDFFFFFSRRGKKRRHVFLRFVFLVVVFSASS